MKGGGWNLEELFPCCTLISQWTAVQLQYRAGQHQVYGKRHETKDAGCIAPRGTSAGQQLLVLCSIMPMASSPGENKAEEWQRTATQNDGYLQTPGPRSQQRLHLLFLDSWVQRFFGLLVLHSLVIIKEDGPLGSDWR